MNIVIYGNCQSKVFKHVFDRCSEFKDSKITFIINFDYINKKKPLPLDTIANCDLFIYQPIGKHHPGYDTDSILDMINKDSKLDKRPATVSFPYIFNLGLFPDYIKGPDSFPYMSKSISAWKQGLTYHLTDDIINGQYVYSIDEMKRHELITDIKLVPFILDNMNKQQLFLTVNHPSNYLLEYLFNTTCQFIADKYPHLDIFRDWEIKLGDSQILDDYTMFVCPEVIKALKLEFIPFGTRVRYKPVTYEQYVECHP